MRHAGSRLLGLVAATVVLLVTAPSAAVSAPTAAPDGTTGAPVGTMVTTVARYGPYTLAPMSHLSNQTSMIQPPCRGCAITAMDPDLVYADGSTANLNTGGMLHHAVLANLSGTDATCPTSGFGERFYAFGNERTPFSVPAGYGYRVSSTAQWGLLVELMNDTMMEQTYYVQVTYTYTTSTATPVRPVWLDIDQCGDSAYSIPAGISDTHRDWQVNVPGRVVAAAGHLHDDGVRVEATRETGGVVSICNSVAGYGETPEYTDMMGMPHLSSMSACKGDLATLRTGDTVRLHSIYDSPSAQDSVMGIMLLYIA